MFDGDYRFAANQRTQWRSVTVPYSTFSLSADAYQPFQKENIGAGILINHDIAGDSRFRTFQVNFTGAYYFKPAADTNSLFSFGALMGFTNRYIDYSALYFDNQFDGYQYNPSLSTGENFARESRAYFNLQLGFAWHKKLAGRNYFNSGIALANITKPKQSYFDVNSIQLDRRFNLHGTFQYALNTEWELIPSTQLQIQGKYYELLFGSQLRYILINEKGVYRAIRAGAFYRTADAGYLLVGLDYDKWIASVSYDINLSTLVPASNYRGGLEFSLIYILDVFKPQKIQHRICPNYI